MELIRAVELLEILADGVNPVTGEVLPDDDSCNQAEVVRALHTVLRAVEQEMQPSKKTKKAQPENAGKPWTAEDDALLCEMFDAGCDSKELCSCFKRTKGAISARLVRLHKISDRTEFS